MCCNIMYKFSGASSLENFSIKYHFLLRLEIDW